jgi:hypothetical protein
MGDKTCTSCDGTGRLYTSSWDDEGFPCPKCTDGLPDTLLGVPSSPPLPRPT